MSGARRSKKEKVLRPAAAVLEAAIARSGYAPRIYPLFALWDALMGAEASAARAVGIKAAKLYVDVDTSVRLHGLTLRKRELIRKLNAAFGGTPLSDIIFRLGTGSPSDDNDA